MPTTLGPRLPGCLRGFPGAVLQLSAAGIVLDSNGRLEAALDSELVGRPFADALDADSSRAKWERMLAGAADASDGTVWELTLTGQHTLPEPRAFSALRESGTDTVWLVEHPRDVRLDFLREQVTEVNSALANAQRDLVKERGRLARALAEQERLSAVLRERNAEIEAQNAALLATTEELARSNRALDEFAHVVSHDLKAPLRSVANAARWIVEDLGDAPSGEVGAHAELMRAQVARMQALIAGILGYARAGRARDEPETVDVGRLVENVVALLDPPPGAVAVDDGLPTLRTAAAPLQQVLQNLIDNAIKHARRTDPRVRVSARPAGDFIEFAVADNGPGIAPRLQERIWNLFQTLEPGADRTGIGLAVVRRLVEAHGGRAWVESSEGAGATFRFLWRTSSPERV